MVVPTVEEFLSKYQKGGDHFVITKGEAASKLIEFAKLHVKAALEKAQYNINRDFRDKEFWPSEDSVLNAYPEENIK